MLKPLYVFEHEKLFLLKDLKPSEFKALARFHDKINSNFYSVGRNYIKFNHNVGVLRCGKRNIHILPKIDKDKGKETEWNDVLIDLIAFTGNFRSKKSNVSALGTKHQSILDLYLFEFVSEVERVIHVGLKKFYRFDEKNISTIKGKILFGKDATKNVANRSKTYCRFQSYEFDGLLNGILRRGLELAEQLTDNLELLGKINQLIELMPICSLKEIGPLHFKSLKFNRNTEYYRVSISIAEMIICNTFVDLQEGEKSVLSFLFDMNHLFEQYVYKICRLQFKAPQYVVHRRRKKFWEGKYIKPDIVIEDQIRKKVVVLDTKWKIPSNKSPNDQDLKQIFIYNHYYSSPISFLVYPSTDPEFCQENHVVEGHYRLYDRGQKNIKNSCHLAFLPINKTGRKIDFASNKRDLSLLVESALKSDF